MSDGFLSLTSSCVKLCSGLIFENSHLFYCKPVLCLLSEKLAKIEGINAPCVDKWVGSNDGIQSYLAATVKMCEGPNSFVFFIFSAARRHTALL